MSITVTIAITSSGGNVVAGRVVNGVATVTNGGANDVTVQTMSLSEVTTTGAQMGQPKFLTANTAPGDDKPTITAAATSYFPFSFVAPSPNFPGDNPNAEGGRVPNRAMPSGNPLCELSLFVSTYDATAAVYVNGSNTLVVPVKSALAPFPVPSGGALQFNSGGDAVHAFFQF
jgi:hypothetical protein